MWLPSGEAEYADDGFGDPGIVWSLRDVCAVDASVPACVCVLSVDRVGLSCTFYSNNQLPFLRRKKSENDKCVFGKTFFDWFGDVFCFSTETEVFHKTRDPIAIPKKG